MLVIIAEKKKETENGLSQMDTKNTSKQSCDKHLMDRERKINQRQSGKEHATQLGHYTNSDWRP